MKWIPIAEPPAKDGRYLVHAPSADADRPLVWVAWWNSAQGHWSLLPAPWLGALSHWMEIPAPPGVST